jgi:hypothetical protein
MGPGINAGVASINGNLCLGTDGLAVGGGVAYGTVTAGFSLPISPTESHLDPVFPGSIPLGDGLYEDPADEPTFYDAH